MYDTHLRNAALNVIRTTVNMWCVHPPKIPHSYCSSLRCIYGQACPSGPGSKPGRRHEEATHKRGPVPLPTLGEQAPAKYLHVSMMHTATSAKELDFVISLLPLLGFLLYLFTQSLVCTGQALYLRAHISWTPYKSPSILYLLAFSVTAASRPQMKPIFQLAESWLQLGIQMQLFTLCKKKNLCKWTHTGAPRPQ